MEFQSVQYTVDRLVQWIRSGRLALPDFQREFVWNPGRVVELLDSVARQWPIGSLLLLSGPQPFGIRAVADAPELKGKNLDYYILDGQQRLTSLYHAVSDVSDFVYYVDFAALDRDEEDYIRWEKREVFDFKYKNIGSRAKNSIALVKDVWEFDGFYAWIEKLGDQKRQRKYVSLREHRLGGLQAKVYKLMAIELDQEIQVEALARIFETLNRTGVRLNAFDLMVAMLYPTGFHLRDRWEDARINFEAIDKFNVDPIEILKLAALLIRSDRGKKASKGVRQGDLLELDRNLIRQYWDRSVALYAHSIDYAKNNLGVYCTDAVPSSGMILGLAGLLHMHPTDDAGIAKWFWGSAFSQVYAQAANTIVVSDFDLISSGKWEASLDQRMADPFVALDESARKNGLALRAMACFIAMRGGIDPVSGLPLSQGESLAIRAISEDTDLRKLTGDDKFDRVVFLTGESDKKLARCKGENWRRLVSKDDYIDRLRTQFIGANFRRDIDYFRKDFS